MPWSSTGCLANSSVLLSQFLLNFCFLFNVVGNAWNFNEKLHGHPWADPKSFGRKCLFLKAVSRDLCVKRIFYGNVMVGRWGRGDAPCLQLNEASLKHTTPRLRRQLPFELRRATRFSGAWCVTSRRNKRQRDNCEAKARKRWRCRWDAEQESGTSVVANGNDMFFHVRPYHKCCDIVGYKKFPLIWKLREGSAWDDE